MKSALAIALALALASASPAAATSRGLLQMVSVPLGGSATSLGAGGMVLAGTAPVPPGGVQSFLEKRAARAAKHPGPPKRGGGGPAAPTVKDDLAPLANDVALSSAPRGVAPSGRPAVAAIPPVAPASVPGGMAQMQVVRLPDPVPPPKPHSKRSGPGGRRGGPGGADEPPPQAAGDAAVVGGGGDATASASPSHLPPGAADTLAAYARANGGALPPGITAPAGVDTTDPVALAAALAAGGVNNAGGQAGGATPAAAAAAPKKKSSPLKSPGVILALVLAGAAAAGAAAAATLSVATTLSHRRKAKAALAEAEAEAAAAVAAAAAASAEGGSTEGTETGCEAGAAGEEVGLTTPLRPGRRAGPGVAADTPASDAAERTIDRAL